MPNHRKKHKNRHQGKNPHVQHPKKEVMKQDNTETAYDHQDNSLLYEIKTSDVMGRYLIASRNIKPGEVIIEDCPLVIGPPTESKPACLGCLRIFESFDSQFRCSICRWPLCGSDCTGMHKELGHDKTECNLLAEHKVADIIDKYNREDLMVAYEIILQLRCLILKLNDKDKWDRLMKMESHNEIRKDVNWLWQRNQFKVVDRIRKEWKIDLFTEDEIHTVCGIIEVNCFEIGPEGAKGRALYPTSYLFSHDCVPNLTHIDNPANYSMATKSLRFVKKSEALTVNYGYMFMGTLKRRQRLHIGKFFWCTCRRCADPTELGTYCSALKCTSCSKGLMLPTDPLNQDALWKCKCSRTINAETVSKFLDALYDELETLDPHNVRSQEQFIEKYTNVLGENHYLILSAKYPLCELYGRAEDFLIDSLSEDLLRHKERYCRDILEIVNVLEPGLSQTKGIIMYELHVALLLLAGKQIENGQITKRDFMKKLKEVVNLLEESSNILKMDPGKKQQEMVHGAEMALISLKMQNLL